MVVTRAELVSQLRSRWINSVIGVFEFCIFAMGGILLMIDAHSKHETTLAVGSMLIFAAGMTSGVVQAVREARKALDLDRFLGGTD